MIRNTCKVAVVLGIALAAAAGAQAAGKGEAELDINDCRVLTRQQQVNAYKKWRADTEARAQRSDRWAITTLAAVAHNVMACHEEALIPERAWAVIIDDDDKGTTETKSPPAIPNIDKRPAVLADLRDLVARTHTAGAFDPAFRRMSAEWVVKYATVLADAAPQAYEDVAGAYQVDCVLKRAIGKRDLKYSCQADRRVRAQLLPRVPPEVRAAADVRAAEWARALDISQIPAD